ncbi:hypothetical protein BDN67DRAFT_965501 [Paxillus ammoniavirescens]|nr:hypothetical protein BDN67DRAFT_965501 [Paxillus ammoniavirescens]
MYCIRFEPASYSNFKDIDHGGSDIGFNFGKTSWSDAKTIALLVVGVVLLIVGGINEIFTTLSAILPARLFKTFGLVPPVPS